MSVGIYDSHQNRIIKHSVFWLLGAAFMTYLSLAQAEQGIPIFINIPSQPLEMALEQLKHATGIPLVFKPEQIAGRNSLMAKGNMSPRQALDALLIGTDLIYKEDNGNIRLHARSTEIASSGKEQPTTLPELVIKQIRETSYVTEEASSATRIPAPIKDVPRSIGVVTRNVIEDQKAFRIDEAIRNVSGTFMSSTQGG